MQDFDDFQKRIEQIEQERHQELKRDLRSKCGKYGLLGILLALTELSQDFGEGRMGDHQIDPDTWWLESSAHLSRCTDEIQRMTPIKRMEVFKAFCEGAVSQNDEDGINEK